MSTGTGDAGGTAESGEVGATDAGAAEGAGDLADADGGRPPGEPEAESGRSRKWAVIAVLPFLAIGLGDVVLLLIWGIDPLWGFAILPPILFCSVLAYLVFSTDFLEGRT